MKLRIGGIVLLLVFSFWLVRPVGAEEDCETVKSNSGDYANCLQRQIDDLAKALEMSKAATAPLESEIKKLEGKIGSIQKQITEAEKRMKDLEGTIEDREGKLAVQYLLLSKKTVEHYKRLRMSSGAIEWLLVTGKTGIQQELGYRASMVDRDRVLIAVLAEEIEGLEKDKVELEQNKKQLAGLQANLDKQADFFKGEVAGAKAYQSDLTGKISSLQASILSARSGSFIASVGDSALADDYNASIVGFRESAPAGSFAVFSFGAYTHRKGMSQYGARGRAQNGQNANTILKAYFGKEPVGKDTSGTIKVAGVGSVDFENYYLMGIAEMPSSWHPEALKAQAIAARTYAYRYKIEGSQICTTEACQVFRKSKADNPPSEWKAAVEATRGQVLEDVVTFYSSTAGGYLTTMGWDTTDSGGGSGFFDKTWEKAGGSPWAYKAWYRQGYTASGATCGKSNPWLSNEEFTDLVNAAIVLKGGNDDRVTPTTMSCWGGNPYSYTEMKAKGGVDSVSSVSVIQGNGATNEVVINGSVRLSGEEFKKGFNLRAPGYLMIPQKGFAFFNVEKK